MGAVECIFKRKLGYGLQTTDPAEASFVTAWNGSSWNTPQQMNSPTSGFGTVDFNLAWNPSIGTNGHYVFAALDTSSVAQSVWYGNSTDTCTDQFSCGSLNSWMFHQPAVFVGNLDTAWDFPSIAVDSSGRIIIGAAKINHDLQPAAVVGYYTATSSNGGSSWSSPVCVFGSDPQCTNQAPVGAFSPGANSRVVAAGGTFHAFIPTLDPISKLPTLVQRWQSFDGANWSGPNSVGMGSFGAPCNNNQTSNPGLACYSPNSGSPILFYASPLMAAAGNANGLWSVAFQVNNNGANNVVACTSSFGCFFVNQTPFDDEFLAGVAVSGDNAFWISLLAYSSNDSMRRLPLVSQAFYVPPGGGEIGATVNSNINPTGWENILNRCNNISCYGAGDFATVASNPFAGSTTPFLDIPSNQGIQGDLNPNEVFQNFLTEPPGSSNIPNFQPNFVRIPPGADITSIGKPLDPSSYGIDSARRWLGRSH